MVIISKNAVFFSIWAFKTFFSKFKCFLLFAVEDFLRRPRDSTVVSCYSCIMQGRTVRKPEAESFAIFGTLMRC